MITIPTFDWKQVDGDMSPDKYGGTIARADGSSIELLKIQPVREYVGEAEAKEVGHPFWTSEACFDATDLDLASDEVQAAREFAGLTNEVLRDISEENRAVAIACAMLDYGNADEGPAGWAKDVLGEIEVLWSSGKKEGWTYLAEEDDEFRREILEESPRITITYDLVTPESAEEGDTAENGWIDEEGEDMFASAEDRENGIECTDHAVKFLRDNGATEPSSSAFHVGIWYSSEGETDTISGNVETRAYHLKGFTPEQEKKVYEQITKS